METASVARFALDPNRTTMHFNQALGDGQSEASAFPDTARGETHLIEFFKDLLQLIRLEYQSLSQRP